MSCNIVTHVDFTLWETERKIRLPAEATFPEVCETLMKWLGTEQLGGYRLVYVGDDEKEAEIVCKWTYGTAINTA